MKKLMTIIAFCLVTCTLWAQNEVNLVVSGEGKDKEEATFKALRSAIEQAYGTFVSANTTVLNDQLVADEIVSLSSGNIKKYEYVSENKMPDGNTFVTLSATVSIDKLVSFAESKGMEAELKGGLFAMNIKKMEFDKQAEEKAVENLCKQLETMLPTLFDYEIEVEEPKMKDEYYTVGFKVYGAPNNNFKSFVSILFKTLNSISLTPNNIESYKQIGAEMQSFWFNARVGAGLQLLKWYLHKEGLDVNNIGIGHSGPPWVGSIITSRNNFASVPLSDYVEKLENLGFYNFNRLHGGPSCEFNKIVLRSQKSLSILKDLISTVEDELYNVSINSGIRDDFSTDIYIDGLGKRKYRLKENEYYSNEYKSIQVKKENPSDRYQIKEILLSGYLDFSLEELSKVTRISVSKPADIFKDYLKDDITGIYYKFHNEIHKEAAKPKTGDLVGINFILRTEDSTLIPLTYNEIEMDSVDYNDLYAAIRMMHIGDSATFIFNGQDFYDLMMDEEYEFGEEPLFLDIKLYGRLPKEEFEKLKLQRKETEDSTDE